MYKRDEDCRTCMLMSQFITLMRSPDMLTAWSNFIFLQHSSKVLTWRPRMELVRHLKKTLYRSELQGLDFRSSSRK